MERLKIIIGICFFLLGLTACQGTSDTGRDSTSTPPVAGNSTEAPRPSFVNIDVPDFAKKINSPNTVLLDVRTPAEIKGGIIKGAITIDITDPDFRAKVNQLDKSKTYLVYCKSGGRSSRACEMMADIGFDSLYNLEGGYMNWLEKIPDTQ